MKLANFFWYLIFLIPWFLSGILFRGDFHYYFELNLPVWAPKPIIFTFGWIILYFLIAYSVCHVFKKSSSNYKIYLVINYFSNQLFLICFFGIKDLFLSLVDVLIVLISSMYLYVETRILKKRYSWYFIPYMIWNLVALILMFSIFIMN